MTLYFIMLGVIIACTGFSICSCIFIPQIVILIAEVKELEKENEQLAETVDGFMLLEGSEEVQQALKCNTSQNTEEIDGRLKFLFEKIKKEGGVSD